MALQKLKWVYPFKRNGAEEIDENRDGLVVLMDVPAGTPILAPLDGEVVKSHSDPRGGGMYIMMIQTPTEDGSYVYNKLSGLASALGKTTKVQQGQQIATAGSGDYFGWDMMWESYLNLGDDTDGDGAWENPLDLAEEMGGIGYHTPLKEKIKTSPKVELDQLPSDIVPYTMPEPATDNKKMLMIGAGVIAAWYFMKKGKK